MFPRIVSHKKNSKKYEYLVISRSVRINGKSTTQDIINLGNVKNFKRCDIVNLIDGLIRIFQLDEYVLGKDIEVSFIIDLWTHYGMAKAVAEDEAIDVDYSIYETAT